MLPRLTQSWSSSAAVVLLAHVLFAVFVLTRIWNTDGIFHEYDAAADSGRVLANGNHRVLGHLLGNRALVTAALGPRAANTTSMRVRPTAAVVVRASEIESRTEEGLSTFTLNRLEQGLRLALLTGAPWLIVSGTSQQCAQGAKHLQEHLRGEKLRSLFLASESFAVWREHIPRSLRRSINAWHCLLSKPIDQQVDLATTGAVPRCFVTEGSSLPTEGLGDTRARYSAARARVMEKTLTAFLETHPRTASMAQSTRALAAFLVAHHTFLHPNRQARGATRNDHGDDDDDDGVSVVSAWAERSGDASRDDRDEHDGSPDATWAQPDVADDVRWQYPRLWMPTYARRCGFGAAFATNTSDGMDMHDLDELVAFMLPGIVTVVTDDGASEDGPRAVADAFRILLERSVLARKRLDMGDGASWWLYNKTYSIIALSSHSTVQRVQLRHLAAFRNSRFNMFGLLRTAVTAAIEGIGSVDGAGMAKGAAASAERPQIEHVLPAFILRPTSVRGGYVSPIKAFAMPTPHYPDVYVLPSAEDIRALAIKPVPAFVSYNSYVAQLQALSRDSVVIGDEEQGEDDTAVVTSTRVSLLDDGPPPPDASGWALAVGRYAHYLYYNYRLKYDALAGMAFALTQYNVLSFLCGLASDVANGRVDWRDLFLAAAD